MHIQGKTWPKKVGIVKELRSITIMRKLWLLSLLSLALVACGGNESVVPDDLVVQDANALFWPLGGRLHLTLDHVMFQAAVETTEVLTLAYL